MGFLTNALNPKTLPFVVATYSQVVQADNALATHFAYGVFMSAAHAVWFSLVAVFFRPTRCASACWPGRRSSTE